MNYTAVRGIADYFVWLKIFSLERKLVLKKLWEKEFNFITDYNNFNLQQFIYNILHLSFGYYILFLGLNQTTHILEGYVLSTKIELNTEN